MLSKLENSKMTILQALLIGGLTGGLATTGIVIGIQNRSARLESLQNQQGEALAKLAQINGAIESGKIELQKNLTAPDLLEVACSKDYLDSHGDLLCRELFCRLQTREGDGASQQECESMANISNSLHIIRACGDTIAPDWETCVETFEKRK